MKDYNKEFNDVKDEYNKELANAERQQGQQTKTNKMSKEKIYCGSGKKQSETWLKVNINVAKFKDHISEYKGHKFIKLNVNILEEPDMYGKDVSITIDTWQPDKKYNDTEKRRFKTVNAPDDVGNIEKKFKEAEIESFDDGSNLPF